MDDNHNLSQINLIPDEFSSDVFESDRKITNFKGTKFVNTKENKVSPMPKTSIKSVTGYD